MEQTINRDVLLGLKSKGGPAVGKPKLNEVEKLIKYALAPVGYGREWVAERGLRRRLRALVKDALSDGVPADYLDREHFESHIKSKYGFRP